CDGPDVNRRIVGATVVSVPTEIPPSSGAARPLLLRRREGVLTATLAIVVCVVVVLPESLPRHRPLQCGRSSCCAGGVDCPDKPGNDGGWRSGRGRTARQDAAGLTWQEGASGRTRERPARSLLVEGEDPADFAGFGDVGHEHDLA